jgi:hypothetical protein
MFHGDRSDFGRWYGLAGVVGLLALWLVLLSGRAATAESGPASSLQQSTQSATDQALDTGMSPQPTGGMGSMASRNASHRPSRWLVRAEPWQRASVIRRRQRLPLDGLGAGGGTPTFAAGGLAQGPQLLALPMPGEDLAVCMTTDRVWAPLTSSVPGRR